MDKGKDPMTVNPRAWSLPRRHNRTTSRISLNPLNSSSNTINRREDNPKSKEEANNSSNNMQGERANIIKRGIETRTKIREETSIERLIKLFIYGKGIIN